MDSSSFVAAIIMGITYGYEVQPENDPYVSAVLELNGILTKGLTPERSAILLAFPFRKLISTPSNVTEISAVAHIPTWFPGAGFQREALYTRQLAQKVLNAPFEFTKSQIVSNLASRIRVLQLTCHIGSWNCPTICGV
jgi:hypothetical protein